MKVRVGSRRYCFGRQCVQGNPSLTSHVSTSTLIASRSLLWTAWAKMWGGQRVCNMLMSLFRTLRNQSILTSPIGMMARISHSEYLLWRRLIMMLSNCCHLELTRCVAMEIQLVWIWSIASWPIFKMTHCNVFTLQFDRRRRCLYSIIWREPLTLPNQH